MLRYMALEALEARGEGFFGEDVVAVLAAADDGHVRLLLYHATRRLWRIAADLRFHRASNV